MANIEQYGIIFITAEEQDFNGEIYNYQDKILRNEFDSDDWTLIWKGQKKHRDDWIVVDGQHKIFVCARKKRTHSYKFYGTIKNDTKQIIQHGDINQGIPNSYMFKLDTKYPRFKKDIGRTQADCVNFLGFNFRFSFKGIYEIFN